MTLIFNQDKNAIANTRATEYHFAHKTSHEKYKVVNDILLNDRAIKRYFSNIASRKKNNGYVSPKTKIHTIFACRNFLRYINGSLDNTPPEPIYQLIVNYSKSTKDQQNQFLDTVQDFSNQAP